jgi:hypothetical protein
MPYNTVLLEKLMVALKVTAFYGTQTFITVFTTAHNQLLT